MRGSGDAQGRRLAADRQGAAPPGAPWVAAATAVVPLLGAAAAVMAWRTATAVDWRLWEAADAVAPALGAAAALAAARFTVEVILALATTARDRPAPRWTGTLARSAAAAVLASILGAGAAQAADPPPHAGWLPPEPAARPWTFSTQAPSVVRPSPGTDGTRDASPASVPATPTAHAAAPATDPASPSPTDGTHVVVPGESLWAITAAALGPGATDAAISAAWPALYAANRDAIGADPGLIHPGQRLTLPTELAAGAR